MNPQLAEKIERFFTQFQHQTYKKGEELVVNIFKPISFFPMSWAINDAPNEYYYEAITELDIYKAPKKEVITFIKNEPEVLYDLLARVFKGTDGITQKITYLMAGNAYARLITELIIYTKRFGVVKNGKWEIIITNRQLAAQVGMTKETVSRELKHLKEKELISFSAKTMILNDLHSLKQELHKDQ